MMPLRKVLLVVLRDLLQAAFADSIAATVLVNFELIRLAKPFPFELLKDFDAVFYSPVENKGEYNTVHLVEACRALHVEAVCFPWLEWHGYCPGASKAVFKNRFQWRYGGLVEAAASFADFETFVDWAIESYPDDATIDAVFASSTAIQCEAERRHDMQVRISDFVLEHHRHSRLFLISDHPSLALYIHVLQQMFRLLNIDGAAACTRLAHDGVEPQWQWRTPIFPRVSERLDLRFRDARWTDEDIVPGRSIDLRRYLTLYFYPDSVILGPIGSAEISSLAPVGGVQSVELGTRLVADRLPGPTQRIHPAPSRDGYRLLEVLSGEPMPLERDQLFEIDDNQWRTSWG